MKLNELKAKQHKSKRTTLQQVRQWRYELIPFLNKAADDAANVAGRTCNALTSVPSVAVVFVLLLLFLRVALRPRRRDGLLGVYSEDYI